MNIDYLQGKFSTIVDQRHQSYVEHKLSDILIIVMSAILCGLDQLCDIYEHACSRAMFFRENFGIDKIPAKPTLCRVLEMMNGEEVASVIIEIMKERADIIGNIIAVDGKTIKNSGEKGKVHSALQMLTAYLTESSVVIGQETVHNKTNEIPVFQAMLKLLDIKGKIVTADAMHCQKETCKEIIQGGGDYVFGLKGNHGTFYNDVALFFNDKINSNDIETETTIEKNRGRIEKRICSKAKNIAWIHNGGDWEGLQTVFAVRRIVTSKNKITDETCYYITSADKSAKELLKIVREHWKIESMHWILDVVFSEDEYKMYSNNGQKTLNILRKLAIMLHRQYISKLSKKPSIKANLLRCLMSDSYLRGVLASL